MEVIDLTEFISTLLRALIGLFAAVAATRIINHTVGMNYKDKLSNLSGVAFAVYAGTQSAAILAYMAWMMK